MNGYHHTGHFDFWFFSAVVMFTLGVIASGLLVFTTWFMCRKRHMRGLSGPLLVDLNRLLVDRLVLNSALAVLLILECATLIWDSLTGCEHFPVQIRWPLDALLILAISVSAVRLFRLYLEAYAVAAAVDRARNGD